MMPERSQSTRSARPNATPERSQSTGSPRPKAQFGRSQSTGSARPKSAPEAASQAPISVVVRVRPLTTAERRSGQSIGWSHTSDTLWPIYAKTLSDKPMRFDHVFGPQASTRELYDELVEDRVERVLQVRWRWGIHGVPSGQLPHGASRCPPRWPWPPGRSPTFGAASLRS